MKNDLVSIIMPVHNSEKFLEDSIVSVLNQSYENLELIIIDDGSTDNSIQIIQSFKDRRIRLICSNLNHGAGIARNKGIEISQGRFIAFLDADDLWMENKIEEQIIFMRSEGVELCYTDYYLINEESEKVGMVYSPQFTDYNDMLKNNYIGCLTAIYDTKRMGKVFMPSRRKRQDWATWLKILKVIPNARSIQKPLAGYRLSKSQMTRNKLKLVMQNLKFYYGELNYNAFLSILFFVRFMYYHLNYKRRYVIYFEEKKFNLINLNLLKQVQ